LLKCKGNAAGKIHPYAQLHYRYIRVVRRRLLSMHSYACATCQNGSWVKVMRF